MGPPKQKWTQEEEAALKAGVDKYGPGKWSTILKDDQIAPLLSARSNVDLKDKWRNMNVGLGGHGSRQRSKNAALKAVSSPMHVPSLSNLSAEPSSKDACSLSGTLMPLNGSEDNLLDSKYNAWVIDAIRSSKDAAGCSHSMIASSIEAMYSVPSNFKKLLAMKLKDMVNQGSLVKVRQNFLVSISPSEQELHDSQTQENDTLKGSATMETESLVGLQAINIGQQGFRSNNQLGVLRDAQDSDRNMLLIEVTKSKARAAEEAARIAVQALAEAEAAAAAAEKAAIEAAAADEELETAEVAAERASATAALHRRGRLQLG